MCKELYEQGSIDKNNKLEAYIDGLAAANSDLETVLKKHQATELTRTTKLLRISEEATRTAAALKLELNKLKLSKNAGRQADWQCVHYDFEDAGQERDN